MSKNARIGGLYKTRSAGNDNIEAMLPDFMKGQADRLIRRACITFSKNPDLENITDEHFRRCVIEAAEMGFAIDGRLCYVVKYKAAYQLQLDYKAVVAVAKRMRTIKDIDADVVREGDHFRHGKYGGQSVLEHTFDISKPRGDVTGAYCRVFLPDGSWNYEVMTRDQLDAIQRRAPAQNGPWKTDPDEMRKKSVIRRKLKMYQDDPGLMRMLEITAWEDEADTAPPSAATVSELTAQLKSRGAVVPANGNGHKHQPVARGEISMDAPDEPTDAGERPQAGEQPDQDLIDGLTMDLPDAQGIGDCEAMKAKWLKHCKTEADRTAVTGLCEARAEEIRASRGERSNSK
jgi:phage RecT family recombinase